MKKIGLAGIILAVAASGCAPKRAPIRTWADDGVLFERRTFGSQSIDIKVMTGYGMPYCTSPASGLDCKIPIEYLTSPLYEYFTMDEASRLCRYTMRNNRYSRWDLQACAVELLSIRHRELAPVDKRR